METGTRFQGNEVQSPVMVFQPNLLSILLLKTQRLAEIPAITDNVLMNLPFLLILFLPYSISLKYFLLYAFITKGTTIINEIVNIPAVVPVVK